MGLGHPPVLPALPLARLLLSVVLIVSSSQPVGAQMDTTLQKLSANSLKQLFQNESPGTSFGGEGELLVKGQRIEVIPSLEHSAQQGGAWLAGVLFDIRIDGTVEPKFTFGTVGIGESTEAAQREAVQEWRAYFCTA